MCIFAIKDIVCHDPKTHLLFSVLYLKVKASTVVVHFFHRNAARFFLNKTKRIISYYHINYKGISTDIKILMTDNNAVINFSV